MFSANSFYLPISQDELDGGNPRLLFGCFIVNDRKENAADYEQKVSHSHVTEALTNNREKQTHWETVC